MINERQKRIIKYLTESKDWKKGKEISLLMGVSDRTIRSDMDAINKFYGESFIESSVKQGYRICGNVGTNIENREKINVPQDSKERCVYILNKLLLDNKSINLLNLENEIFISYYTIEKDLKRIRKQLSDYEDLRIVRSKNFIKLVGSEKSKRKLYKNLLIQETKGNFINLNILKSLYNDFNLMEVVNILENILNEYQYKLRETSLPMFLMHIGVSIERMLHHNYIKMPFMEMNDLKNSVEYKIIYEFYSKVSNRINIELVDAEVQALSLLLMGKKSENYTGDQVYIHGKLYSISKLVHIMLEDLYKVYDINLLSDMELVNGLKIHMRSLITRRTQGINVDNVYLQDIKCRYPLVFDMSIQAMKSFQRNTELDVEENEIGFLALHLGAAYERSNMVNKIRAVLIYPHEDSMKNLNLKNIQTKFKDRMEIIAIFNMFEESRIMRLNPDLVISTLNLSHSLDILTIKISIFMTRDDENKILQSLNYLEEKKRKMKFDKAVQQMIKKELFFVDLDFDSPSEIIKFLSNHLYEKGYVNEHFYNDVMQRESISATSFGLGVAIPHALNTIAVKESCISVALLKNSVKWGEYDIQLVILSATVDCDREIIQYFFDWLSKMITNPNKMIKLLQVRTYKQFLEQYRNL